MEALPEYHELRVLAGALGKVSGKEFGDVISIAMPDTQYGALVLRQAEVEQKLAAISEQFAADHPEVVSLRRTLETINRLLGDRREGILAGLQTKAESLRARLYEIEQELDKLKRRPIDTAIRNRQYYNSRNELENYRRIRDSIQARIFEESINSTMRSKSDSRLESPPAKP